MTEKANYSQSVWEAGKAHRHQGLSEKCHR